MKPTIQEAKSVADRFASECVALKAPTELHDVSQFGLAVLEARKRYTDLKQLVELTLAVGSLLRKHRWSMGIEALAINAAALGGLSKAARGLHDQMAVLRPELTRMLDHISGKGEV
jgi:hypothetical protein